MLNGLDIRGGVAEVLQALVALRGEERMNATQHLLLACLEQALKEAAL
jgi:hypothetical protein